MKTKMMSNICYLLVTLIALVSIVDCVKKLPPSMSPHQYCHGCMATMKELAKKLPKKLKGGRSVAVVDALEKICSPSNFVEYHYSPPKTVKACQLLLENNEDEIETALMKNEDDIVTLICNEVTGACNGIDLGKDSKDAKFADIDLTNDGDGATTKSVNVDPSTGKVMKEEKEKKKADNNKGKTLSKSSKKKKQKKKKGESAKSKKKEKETVSGGKQKGAIHNLNIDINDPDSVKKVMEQINSLTGKYNAGDDEKDEL